MSNRLNIIIVTVLVLVTGALIAEYVIETRPEKAPSKIAPSKPAPSSKSNVAPVFHDAKAQKLQAKRLKAVAAVNETTWMGKQILHWIQSHPRYA